MRLTTFSLIFLVLITACSPEPANNNEVSSQPQQSADAQVTESQRLNLWLDQQYQQQLQFSPMTLTQLGRKELYDQIDDFSEQAEDEQLAWREKSVAELHSSFDYAALTDDAKISYDLWGYQYEQAKAMLPFRRHEYVFTQMQGVHTYLPNFLINIHKVEEEADLRAYIARIDGVSRAIVQLLERAKLGAQEDVRPPRFAYEAVIAESRKLITGAPFMPQSDQDAPLWADVKTKVDSLQSADKVDHVKAETLKAQAKLALLDKFKPAYQQLVDWLESDLGNTDAVAQGVGSLHDGEAFYTAALKRVTTTALSADEIHRIGLQEVARIREQMEEIKHHVEFSGSLADFFHFIRTDRQFFYDNNDAGRQAYIDDSTAYIDYINTKLPEYFGLLPKADLVVKRVESFREQDGAPQHYYPSSPDGARPGTYYAHLSDMTSMPKSEMEAVAYHEAIPGHHMQIAIAQELTGIPEFRTQVGFTSYVEGWGLYAETLAKEMGAYQDPYTDFGRLTTEIWRAIRLVVDTGIHSKGWTGEQALEYFRQNSPIAEGQIRAEVRRYIVWPGQATAYKIGMLKILELRQRAQVELGERFDIREFHDVVLGGGAVPLSVLETRVDRWIARKKV